MINAEPHGPRFDSEALIVYVGTYTRGDSEGIYRCRLDMKSGALEQLAVAGEISNPSFLAIDTERLRLFAVSEQSESGGTISAFAIQPTTGDLSLISRVSSHGDAPCYLSVDQSGNYVLAVNYMGGNLVVVPVDENGALGLPTTIIAHSGSGQHATRQDAPHPHSIVLDPANNHTLVPDLGLDKVMRYRFDRATGRLVGDETAWTKSRPGSGPRHLAFSPIGRNVYVVGELDSSVTAYTYDPDSGNLIVDQTVSMIPKGYSGSNLAADIHLTPDGRFLYASNRGHDSIAAFAVDQTTGRLTCLGFTSTQGKSPRGFAIDPTGTYLLVANQLSNEILSFRINRHTGSLQPTGSRLEVPSPVCIKLLSQLTV